MGVGENEEMNTLTERLIAAYDDYTSYKYLNRLENSLLYCAKIHDIDFKLLETLFVMNTRKFYLGTDVENAEQAIAEWIKGRMIVE